MPDESVFRGARLCVIGDINRDLKTAPLSPGEHLFAGGETSDVGISETIGVGRIAQPLPPDWVQRASSSDKLTMTKRAGGWSAEQSGQTHLKVERGIICLVLLNSVYR
jgi:hypothetical protein